MDMHADSPLVQGAGELWEQGTQARFLSAIGDGTLPAEAFQRWLAQDYRFALGMTSFQGIMAAKTPRPAQKTVIAGLAALDAEMDWFENHLVERGLDLAVEPHPVCRRYTDFLLAAAYTQPFEVLLAVLYGVEVAYLVAWGGLEAKGPYAEFIERWTNEAFQGYVAELRKLAERHAHPAQQTLFNEVLRHEGDFWSMTWEG